MVAQSRSEQQLLPWTSPSIAEATNWYNTYIVGNVYQTIPETLVFFRVVKSKTLGPAPRTVVRVALDNVVVHDSSSPILTFLLVDKSWDSYDIEVADEYASKGTEGLETSYVGPVLTFLHGEELWQFVNLTDCPFNPFERVALPKPEIKPLKNKGK